MVFCMKLFNLNGNNELLLLSSMMVYTFIGILFPYSSIHYEFSGCHSVFILWVLSQVGAGDGGEGSSLKMWKTE